MQNQYSKINNILGWIVFLIACFTYFSTIEPTASFWDCGEYIATAYKLEVGHPPGAPLFLIIGRFFSMFASSPTEVAKMVNYMSALSSAFTILFLFWTITAIGKKIANAKDGIIDNAKLIAIMGSGVVGALAYNFSDSFWFSAVEGEVYAMSSFFTAIVVWAMFKWDSVADEPHANRWIILIAYLMGLSIGVHLLNLLTIPALTFIYYFRKYKPTRNGIIYTSLISLGILVVVMYGVIPGLVKLWGSFELFFVNTLGLPFNSGTWTYFLLLAGGIVFGLHYTAKHSKIVANTALLCLTVIIIGYSSFALIIVRSNANPPMDENNPDDAISLLSYLLREQYGERPLGYGQYYNAPLDAQQPYKDKNPTYMRDEKAGNYAMIDDGKNKQPNYDARFCTVFPRMFSEQGSHVSAYKSWADIKGTPIKVTNYKGETETIYKPTFGENLKFFFTYQLGHMYWRYFMWNFVGRQNDIQGHGEKTKGNWISGVSAVDKMVGNYNSKISPTYANNKGMNKYYFLPLILGIIGLLFHFNKHSQSAWIVFIIFLFTGLAINVYLNPTPYQPRERDYAYVGSYYAYAMWIGLGVYGLFDWLGKKLPQVAGAALFSVLSLSVPAIMANQNWDDHDRSNRYTARDFAHDYLNSCAKNAIIFTNGDNDTFPLWYAQEVEGIRTDIRVVNLSLAQTDWYINQLRQKYYDSEPVKLTLSAAQIRTGTRDYVPVYPRKEVTGFVDLKELMGFVASDDAQSKLQTGGGQELNYFPTGKFSLKVNKEQVMKTGGIPKDTSVKVLDAVEWEVKKQYIMKNDLLILDILASNNWERPVYFAVTVGDDSYLDMEGYFQLEGLAYRLVPFRTQSLDGQVAKVNTELMYDNMMNKFKWGGMENEKVYMDENNQRMTMNIRNNFARLADALIAEGQKEKATKVLDKCIEVMPEKNIPYNFFILPVAEGYYKLGQFEKANKIVKAVGDNYYADLQYFMAFKGSAGLEYSIQQGMAVLQKVVMLTKGYKQDALTKDFETKFNELNAVYAPAQQQQQSSVNPTFGGEE